MVGSWTQGGMEPIVARTDLTDSLGKGHIVPPPDEGVLPMNRRTLYRALAVVVALAAISPLLIEVDPNGGDQQLPSRAAGSQPLTLESPLHH